MMYFVLSDRLERMEAIWGEYRKRVEIVEVAPMVAVGGIYNDGAAIVDVLAANEGWAVGKNDVFYGNTLRRSPRMIRR